MPAPSAAPGGLLAQALDGQAQHRQGRAQLVAGVGGESPLAGDEVACALVQLVEVARQFTHLVVHLALLQAGQAAGQVVGPAARHGLRQAGQRCAGAPGQQGRRQQRHRHRGQAAGQQPCQQGLAQRPHHQLLAHLGHQQAAIGVQAQQVEVAPALAFELAVARPRGVLAGQIGGQALALRVEADEGQRRGGPRTMGAAMQMLPIGFGAQRGGEKPVFHHIDKQHCQAAEQQADEHRVSSQHQHQPALQPRAVPCHPGTSSRRPTPCTVFTSDCALPSAWRNV
jgi:hypothetical protein